MPLSGSCVSAEIQVEFRNANSGIELNGSTTGSFDVPFDPRGNYEAQISRNSVRGYQRWSGSFHVELPRPKLDKLSIWAQINSQNQDQN